MGPAEIRQFCRLANPAGSLMRTAMAQLQLTARAYHRVIKVARTIADLAGEAEIGPAHLAEALAVPGPPAPSEPDGPENDETLPPPRCCYNRFRGDR